MPGSKQLWLFFVSMCSSFILFSLFVFMFPFPRENETEIFSRFLPWVAVRTSLYTPYKYWWPLGLLVIPAVTFCLWHILSYWHKCPLKVQQSRHNIRKDIPLFTSLEIGIVCVIILFLLVNFSFSSFYQFFYNYHHVNFIAGPINDVLAGKHLLVDVKAQYGFLNILLASFVFKYFLYFSHTNIHFISMILGCLEYLCIYFILRILTRNVFFSFAGLFFITATHFYGVFGFLFPSELYVWPGGSVWRFFPAMPSALCLLLWLKSGKKIWLHATHIGVVVGFLWNLEAGAPLLLAYLSVVVMQWWFSNETFMDKSKRAMLHLGYFIITAIFFLATYTLYIWISVQQLPQWSWLFYFTALFNSGFLQNKNGAPLLGVHYWPILMYGMSIFLTMIRKYCKPGLPIKDLVFLSFLSVYGYGIYRYYIGKQSSSDLAAVIIPAGIIFIYLFYQIFQKVLLVRVKKVLVVVASIMLVFFLYQQGRFIYWTVRLFSARYTELKTITIDPNVNHPPRNHIIAIENTVVNTIPWTEVLSTIKNIEKYIPAGKPIATIGYFDHILLMQSGRSNIVDYWYIHTTMYTKDEVKDVEKKYIKEATYLFVDKRIFRNNPTEYVSASLPIGEQVMLELFQKLRPYYAFEKDIGMLYVYKRKELR